MASRTPHTDIDHAFNEDSAPSARDRSSHGASPSGSPTLAVASVVAGVAGLACGYFVSWIVCVLAGIVAIALGVIARRRNTPKRGIAVLGIVLGVVCILACALLIGMFYLQLANLGLL